MPVSSLNAPFDSLMRFWRGRKLIGREEYTQSASDLKLAALENPEDWECWYYLGVACYLSGMYEEAKVAHANSKTLMKKYGVNALPATTDWYWMICMKLGQPEEAAKALEDITPDMPTEDGDYLCRVLLYKGVLKPENFVEECEKNCKNPERPRIYHLMLTYVYMGWWMIVFPAIFTALSVLGFNLFGDGLRDLIDPLSGR